MSSILKTHPVLKIVNGALVDLPSPANISSLWNFGSLLGLCLVVQLGTGLFLAMHYCADVSLAFSSVRHIGRDVNYGWLLRILHANGASFFFYVFIRARRARALLRLLCFSLYVSSRGGDFAGRDGHSLFRVRFTLRANVLLRGHGNYKSLFSDPLHR